MLSKKIIYILFFLLTTFIGYYWYTNYLLKPGEITQFSLIDDGQQIENSYFITTCLTSHDCTNVENILAEKHFGRLRPFYWLIQWSNTFILGLNASLHHNFRVFFWGGIIFLGWTYFTIKLKINYFVSLILFMLLVLSPTYTENILRLGPTEPYLLIGLIIASVNLFSGGNYIWVGLILFLTTFIKETAVVSFIPLLLSKPKKGNKIIYLIIYFLVAVTILLIYKNNSEVKKGALLYSTNYQINYSTISANMMKFAQVVYYQNPILTILGASSVIILILKFDKLRKNYFRWLIMMSGINFLILIPWSFVLERYVLVTLFYLYILFAYSLTRIISLLIVYLNFDKYQKLFVEVLLLPIITLNVLSTDYLISFGKAINYKQWIKTYVQFESEYVKSLSNILGDRNLSKLFIESDLSLDNWEVEYEIPIHLKYLYGINITMDRNVSNMTPGDLLLSSSSLMVSKPSNKSDKKLLSENKYELRKYNIDKLVNTAREHPLSFLTDNKLVDYEIKWWWKIYEKIN